MGWTRTFHYVRHRLVRTKDTTHSVALGLAFGAAVSFTPLPGTHILQAMGFSYVLKGNAFAGFIGTAVGNPWTFGPMWWASYVVGEFVFTKFGLEVRQMPENFSWEHLVAEIKTDPLALVLPWVTGGFVMAALSWPVFYGLFYWMVRQARVRQGQWKEHRLHKEGLDITGRQSE